MGGGGGGGAGGKLSPCPYRTLTQGDTVAHSVQSAEEWIIRQNSVHEVIYLYQRGTSGQASRLSKRRNSVVAHSLCMSWNRGKCMFVHSVMFAQCASNFIQQLSVRAGAARGLLRDISEQQTQNVSLSYVDLHIYAEWCMICVAG